AVIVKPERERLFPLGGGHPGPIPKIDDGTDAELLERDQAFGRRLASAVQPIAHALKVRYTFHNPG
ncbi:MAG TPA: hypothetical protein VFT55_18200, partial [Planctomycetota bacterium]|nr:hypothetical protein [Planctomycetota bacterium]